MNYISIDIAKDNHKAMVSNSSGEILVNPFDVSNNRKGFELLVSTVSGYKEPSHIVGVESTGHYGQNLIKYLLDHGFSVGQINPLSTDAMRKMNIRKAKNDRLDTFLIARVMQEGCYTKEP